MNKELLAKIQKMSNETRLHFIEGAKDYAMYRGIAMRKSHESKDERIHLPFCLLPTEFPREWFEYVYNLQTSINLVLHKISYSKEILRECLSSTIETDEFTRNLYNIFEAVFENQSKLISLGIVRSDYMLSCDKPGRINGIKQVENNTISVGFGGISPMLRNLYRFILERLDWKNFNHNLPENKSCKEIARAMVSAWWLYGKPRAVFLFVVEEATFNIYDQRFLEFKVLEYGKHLEVVRCTFKDLRIHLQLRDEVLYVYNKEVGVVYFRVGYAPEHYEPEDWTTRLLIEQSKAIKCPSVGLHLAGTKKVQLYLTQVGVLEKFIDPETAEKLRKVFANQFLLDKMSKMAVSEVIKYPEEFVLKPEREGGGNNLYGLDIKKILESEHSEKMKSYILMERINPPAIPNYVIRSNRTPEPCLVHSELGIYGVVLGSKENLYINETVGHLLRSKPVNFNEGGVASGSGALDYSYLV